MLAVIAFFGIVIKECWPGYRDTRSSSQAGHCLECDLKRVTSLLSAVLMPYGDVTLSYVLQALRLIIIVVVVTIIIVLLLVLVLLL